MEGFNNFEQGILIACAIASTLSLGWMAIIFTSHCLRSIEINYSLRRMKETLVTLGTYLVQRDQHADAGDVIGRAIDLVSLAEFTKSAEGLTCTVPVDRVNRLAAALAAMNRSVGGTLAQQHPESPNG